MSQSKNITKIFGGVEVLNFIDSNNSRLQNVATPIEPYDGANKEYVDSRVSNVSISAGVGIIDDNNVYSVDSHLTHVTQLGNIQVGTWTADTITVNYGGTGTTSFTPNKLIIGNGTNPLQSYSHATFDNNSVTFSNPVQITNTTNSVTPSSGGAITVLGGIGVVKDAHIGGKLTAYEGTIQNLSVPGILNISTIQSFSSNLTNLTASNLNSTNNTINNMLITNVTGTSQIFTSSTISNSYTNIGTTNNLTVTTNLNSGSVSTANLIFTNATGRNFFISNTTSSNCLFSLSTIQSSIITNATAPNIQITNCTNTNLYTQNGNFLNSIHTNITCNNGILNNITGNSLFINNLTSGNSNISNLTSSNIFNTNLTSSNLNNTNMTSSNIRSTNITTSHFICNNLSTINNLYSSDMTTSNLNVINTTNLNNTIINNITCNTIISSSQSSTFSNNTNLTAVNSTLSSLQSNNISTSSLNSNFITSSSLLTINSINTNISSNNLNVTNIVNTTLTNSTSNNINLVSSRANILTAVITNSSLVNSSINRATISSLTITDTLSFRKALNIGNNYSSPPLTSSGSLFTTNPINFTDNTTLVRNAKWFGSYFSKATLSALNPNVKTTQAATVYIHGKPLEGINQTIDYAASLALGYVPNTIGSSLTGQIMFERFDGNWFSSMYIDPNDRLVINNASANANAGIGVYVYNNNPITFSSIPNVSNITPSDFITFSSNTSTFYSTTESTNLSSASVVFNGGVSIGKSLTVLGITTGNINFTGTLYQNGQPYISSQWTTTNGNLFFTGGNVGIYNTAPTTALDISGGAKITGSVSTGELISSGLTTGNINFTGTLYQNGQPYISSQWTTSNGNLFYTSGNIGIFNTAPTTALDISGGARITGSVSTGELISSELTTGNINFTGALYKNGQPYISSQWTSSNGNLFYTEGNVGIFNTAPSAALDIIGDLKVSGSITAGSFLISNLSTTNITTVNLSITNFTSNNLVTNNINFGVSSFFSGSFNASNNVLSASNVTGLIFSSSNITSFTAHIGVIIKATTNLSENFTIKGSYSSTGWVLYSRSIGDNSGITFTIDASGQIKYTSTNISGYTSSIFRFTVNQISVSGNYSSLSIPTTGNTYAFDSINLSNTTDSVVGVSTGAANIEGGVNIKKSLTVTSSISCGSLLVKNNLQTGSGILGPTFLLQNDFIDVFDVGLVTSDSFTASNSIIFTEPGNPGLYSAIGNNSGFGTGIISNSSNDSMTWNYARLIIRGVSLNTTTASTICIQPYILQGTTETINTQSSFLVSDSGTLYGYSTWVSPWFPTNSVNDLQSLGIKVLSMTTGNLISSGSVRIGPTYLQYSS
jgi:hypothetical protein